MIHIKTTHHPFGSSFPPTCTTRCFHFTLFTCLPVSLVACIFCSPLLSCCFWPPLCFLPHTCPAPLCKLFCLLRLSPTLSDCHKISVFLPLSCPSLLPLCPPVTPLFSLFHSPSPTSLTPQVVMHPSCSRFLLWSHLILLLSQRHAALQPKCPALSSSHPTLCEVPLL